MKTSTLSFNEKSSKKILLVICIILQCSSFVFAQQTIWKHSTGSFRRENGANWVEFSKAKRAWAFVKLDNSTYNQTTLYDQSRDCYVALTHEGCWVKFGKAGKYEQYYSGTWSNNSGFNDEMGLPTQNVANTPTKTKEEIERDALANKKTQLEIEALERAKKEDDAKKLEEIKERQRLEEERRKKEADEKAEKERLEEERRKKEAEERAEKERLRKEAEKQKILDEDKAVGGANSRMRNGILGGNLEMVKKAVEEGANASATFEGGQNTLMLAVKNAKILEFLIQKGADVTQKRASDGRTALHLADNEDAAIVLSNYSSDLEIRDYKGNTPLEVAIMNSKSSAAIYLIEKGANINSNNGTPLSLACGMGSSVIQMDVVRLLLIKGVNVNQSPDGFSYPLHLAAKNDNYELANLLLQYSADEDLRDGNNQKPKSYAKSKELKKLLK